VVADSELAQRRVEKNTRASASPGRELAITNLARAALFSSLLFQLGSVPQNFCSLHNLCWKRTLRTASSERFLAQHEGKILAALDLQYLASGTVGGTVILLKEAGWRESDVPALLGSLDEDFLSDVDLNHGNLNHTVVLREVLERLEAENNSE
jgi:hypothetical protein